MGWSIRSDQIGIAIIRGDARLIAELLLSEETLSSFVLRALHLWSAGRGPGNWAFKFHYRGNGRPTGRYVSPAVWKIISDEEAVRAVENGDLRTLASYLKRTNFLGPALRQILGASLQPDSLWQLRFSRPGPGNPASSLRTGLKRALLGHEALRHRDAAKEEAVNRWKDIRYELAKKRGASVRQIDIAIRCVHDAQRQSGPSNSQDEK
jgi:hypothetical protein